MDESIHYSYMDSVIRYYIGNYIINSTRVSSTRGRRTFPDPDQFGKM